MSLSYRNGNVYIECDECGNDVKVGIESVSDSVYCSTCNQYLAVPVHRVLAKYRAYSQERNQHRLDKEQRKYERIEDKKFARRYEKDNDGGKSFDLGSAFLKIGFLFVVFMILSSVFLYRKEERDRIREQEIFVKDMERSSQQGLEDATKIAEQMLAKELREQKLDQIQNMRDKLIELDRERESIKRRIRWRD
jgi:hypothetical protein